MNRLLPRALAGLALAGVAAVALAQSGGEGRRWHVLTEKPTGPIERGDVPTWPLNEKFAGDIFTFARIHYTSSRPERSSFAWFTDFPDADLNLSYRLQQLTSIRVNPEPKVLDLTDPELFDYPWIFLSGAGNIVLTDEEAAQLRKYLLDGGFLTIDDFWGQAEWDGVARALKKVFPEREPRDVPRSDRIFHCVYNLPDDLPLQTSNIRSAVANRDTGITWEDGHAGGNTREIHFRAIYDDKQRMMVFLCHNTDNGDGWEEESSDPWFFSTFSEKRNYPLAINIIVYAMTH